MPLPPVLFALACQESLTEKKLRTLQRGTFAEIIMTRDENVLHIIGVVEEIKVAPPEPEV